MTRGTRARTCLAALAAIALCLAAPADAGAARLLPPGKRVFFGVSDTGNPANFGEFSEALNKHPALIETFRSWGSDFHGSIERWQDARARPVLHLTTADPQDGHELITPRAIAQGRGDSFLIRLNRLFSAKGMPAYIRPLGEPNRCLNPYAFYDCAGQRRDAAHKPRWYRLAFRRMYIVLHGGGKLPALDARLAKAGLPPLRGEIGGLPKAPVAVIWGTLPAGSPTVPGNRPRHFYPGWRYVDWVGTDFYSDNQDWKALTGLYNRFAGKPFALPEFGISTGDDTTYVKRLFVWVRRHKRCRMLVYYQDFGSTSPYRIQNYPASLATMSRFLHNPVFPPFAPHFPEAPPPPPGGVAP
ncbi:MAG: hypothetical protein ACM3N0_13615 [Chloroflexota bacterium]